MDTRPPPLCTAEDNAGPGQQGSLRHTVLLLSGAAAGGACSLFRESGSWSLSSGWHPHPPPPGPCHPELSVCTSSPLPSAGFSPQLTETLAGDRVTTMSSTYFPVAPLPPLLPVFLTTGHPTAPAGPFLVYTRSLADLMGSYTTHPLRTVPLGSNEHLRPNNYATD